MYCNRHDDGDPSSGRLDGMAVYRFYNAALRLACHARSRLDDSLAPSQTLGFFF